MITAPSLARTVLLSASCTLLLGLLAGCSLPAWVKAPPPTDKRLRPLSEGLEKRKASPPDTRTVLPEVGYKDTPVIPGSTYRVHDGSRPQPATVLAGDHPRLPAPGAAPSDARILFDGNDLDQWQGRNGVDAAWKIAGDAMQVNGTGDISTIPQFGDVQLHLEFRTPKNLQGDSQGRGNSGVFFLERYEVQILDSWKNPTYPDGQAAALYGQQPPLVNASLPPGEWQSYDIVFLAPRFAKNGSVERPARATVFHNGILVQHDVPFQGPTRHRTLTEYEPHPVRAPIRLQDHGNPVEFRNIWVRELSGEVE